MSANDAGGQLAISQCCRHNLGPVRIGGDHLWPIAAIADATANVAFTDPVVGQARQIRNGH